MNLPSYEQAEIMALLALTLMLIVATIVMVLAIIKELKND